MSLPSGPEQRDPTTSTVTLPPSQLAETEKGFQFRSEAVCDSNQETEPQSSAEKEEARQDKEWLENPAHPRNWSSRKKWVNMAIVS